MPVSRRAEKAFVHAANLGWKSFQTVNTRLPEGKPFQPSWAPRPLLKSYERSKPPLGVPRETDSLCPKCVIEVKEAIIRGEEDIQRLVTNHPGEIKAHLVEEDGKVWMKKRCEKHGEIVDMISADIEFTKRLESLFPGRDFKTVGDELVHRHGSSSIKYGRGAVMTIDLTNRCNMMCNPCFMDANQVGYVHEPTLDDLKEILDRSISFKPKRQLALLFSGGEPTVAPTFLPIMRYATDIGYYANMAATNGIRFAQDPDFAFEAYDATLNTAYLQFDGVGNLANSHRHISNLFDVKLQAIENMAKAGISITLVVTIVNGLNNDQVGPIIKFAIENSDKISAISFQPVSFTGRDEGISDERRHRQRYTLAHLAHDVKSQTGMTEPLRDWFPLSSLSSFTAVADHLRGPEQSWGGLNCSCHPNCGIATILMANKRTGAWAPISEFFNMEQFFKDIFTITDSSRGKKLTAAQTALAFARNYIPEKAPPGFSIKEMIRQFDMHSGGAVAGDYEEDPRERKKNEWFPLWIGGMWFQDLWVYDFRRTEMCVIPYGTQEGEISFCAYNTGVGWRQIIENMHMTSTTAEWFKTRGRHKIYAGERPVDLPTVNHSLKVIQDEPSNGNGNGSNGNGKANGNGHYGSKKDAKKEELAVAE
ncbi:radical SAM protein [candidate division KSB1 bacterium]|nr:radical SAM protein [candidate division KSB1 bacterium]NIR71713.1 radical SAM protein [candidate division KSB1 bacterium]NIS28260.1 radical SAM protein [candidate division KSB1 bacterium]NIT70390.1 radical SAM protein [candidate division KSB1 bacterium]NIU28938.1 radical SAM protein [candidate division KSB1 bacterium]